MELTSILHSQLNAYSEVSLDEIINFPVEFITILIDLLLQAQNIEYFQKNNLADVNKPLFLPSPKELISQKLAEFRKRTHIIIEDAQPKLANAL